MPHDLDFRNKTRLGIYLSLCRQERRNFTLSLLMLVIKHSPAMVLPIVIGHVINAIIAGGPGATHRILVNSAVILALLLQNIFTHTWFIQFLSVANRSMEKALRCALVVRMQELSIAFHTRFESGRLQSKMLRDVESIEILTRQMMNVVITGLLTILFAMVVTLLHSFTVALFYLATIPISTLLIRIFQRRMALRNQEYRTEIEVMSARMNEMVQMIPMARAHAAEDVEIRQMRQRLDQVQTQGIRLDVLNAIFGSCTWVTYQIFQFLCLLVTGLMALHGRIPVGDVVMYQGFFALIINSVNMIINVYPELTRGFDSLSSLGEILACPEIEPNAGKQVVAKVTGHVQFQDVSFHYAPGQTVIEHFELEVQPGECVALVGESGAGKSTLMGLLIGTQRPSSGRILLDGQDMNGLDLRSYRRFLSVVPQSVILFSGSIREIILYGFDQDRVDEAQFLSAATMARVDEFVRELPDGYETRIGEHGSRLSGGQRQRIAIARALIRDPRMIIFDEATSALDVQSEQAIQAAIADLIKGRTTFMIAHRLSTIRKAHKIIVLDRGRIVEAGSHEALIQRQGAYFRMHSAS